MTPDQKALTARILGYICVVAGLLNLTIVGVRAFRGGMAGGFPLLGSGLAALMLGLVMLTRGRQKPTSNTQRP